MRFVQPIRELKKIDEIKDCLRNDNPRNYILFTLGINTGLRISDLLKLRAGMVRGTHITMYTQKRNKPISIKLNRSLREELSEYTKGMRKDEFLFQSRLKNPEGRPLTRSGAYRVLRKIATDFDLEEIGTHSLRKTFGYHFYRNTKDIALLMEIFNHTEQSITLRYIGIKQDTLDEAMDDFEL